MPAIDEKEHKISLKNLGDSSILTTPDLRVISPLRNPFTTMASKAINKNSMSTNCSHIIFRDVGFEG